MRSVRPIETLKLPFDCAIDLPGSKSEASRSLVLAALTQGVTRIEGATLGDDVIYMAEGLMALGFEVDIVDAARGSIVVKGGLPEQESEAEIFCGNAGTVVRFLVSVAALVPGRWKLTGDAYLRGRPMAPLIEAWRSLGLEIEATNGGLPLRIVGGIKQGGRVTLDASVSSQFLSSLLLVGHCLEDGLEVDLIGHLSSSAYVALTLETMKRFHLRTQVTGSTYKVTKAKALSPGKIDIEGDWSAAGPFLTLAELTTSRFVGSNLKHSSLQADRRLPEFIAAMRVPGDLEINITPIPDQLMNLAVLAAHRDGKTRFIGAKNLRQKECDRIAVTAREFERAGVAVEEHDDGITITGTKNIVPVLFDPENDHRFVMALSLFGAMKPGFAMLGRRCVGKSYPSFFDHLERATREHRALIIVGMRASGKSRLGKELAERLDSKFVDADQVFEQRHGDIADYVADSGWQSFREVEEAIAAEHCRAGLVVALGGGAFESDATRQIAQDRGVVIFIDEELDVIRERIKKNPGQRPALSPAGVIEELDEIFERRRPQFLKSAQVRIPGGMSTENQAEFVIKELSRRCSW